MKLGGGLPAAQLRRPGRLWAGLGLCLGLAVGALGAAAFSGYSEGIPPIVHIPGRPGGAWEEIRPLSAGGWNVAVATRKSQASTDVSSGDQVTVQWQRRKVSCVSATSNTEEWNCGRDPTPPGLPEAQWRRVVVLAAPPGSPESGALALDLLDSGSADQVVITTEWRPYTRTVAKDFPSSAAILVLPRADWGKLRNALRFEGIRTVQQVWPNVELLAGSPSAQLRGLPACRNGEPLEEDGMTFVRVCPGTFTMGSANNDPQANDDEKPAHQVTLSEYWIGRTEVTNGQYRKDHPAHQGPDALPATNVSWDEAKNFCESHNWRLPSEAEWEYAARAGTQTPWSFEGGESQLGEYAWFDGNSGGEAHPVATRKSNLWGIHDMHGNVWEWVEDWYGPYEPGPQADPKGPATGTGRALRGGAFSSPWGLRSAGRSGFRSAGRINDVGFRCARSPRPQP